ncbi:MAG: cobyric acid synthase [Anaerolineae bacterium]|nr:cobyric acid synthase [Anaerolineae bacterium]
MPASVLMILGTTSSAGKSLLVTALCRIYARRGLRVAPFKAQNMSNNAAVCIDGAEIGRAQYTQALACGIEPRAEMNPILLKPEADARSQVIVMGKPWGTLPARHYYRHKGELWQTVTAALDSLRADVDLVIAEGAGSPVEMNLKKSDLVNMAVAKYAQAPVLLAGDIDRGGVFAQLLGTLWLLEPDERTLVKGLLVNKFRGDLSLFSEGIRILEERGGVPVLGVIPYLDHGIPEEDAVAIERQNYHLGSPGDLDIAVVRLPRISNFDDFDPLAAEPGVRVRYVDAPQELGQPDGVIVPGTKSTLADLAWLKSRHLDEAIRQLADRGAAVIGICGGYQMLGERIADPQHIEGAGDEMPGLGLLPVETTFIGRKSTYQTQARICTTAGWTRDVIGQVVSGYEIHMGETRGDGKRAWLELVSRGGEPATGLDGAISLDGRVWGCYLHGLFANQGLRRAWLGSMGWHASGNLTSADGFQDEAFEQLADGVEASLDRARLDAVIGLAHLS